MPELLADPTWGESSKRRARRANPAGFR